MNLKEATTKYHSRIWDFSNSICHGSIDLDEGTGNLVHVSITGFRKEIQDGVQVSKRTQYASALMSKDELRAMAEQMLAYANS